MASPSMYLLNVQCCRYWVAVARVAAVTEAVADLAEDAPFSSWCAVLLRGGPGWHGQEGHLAGHARADGGGALGAGATAALLMAAAQQQAERQPRRR